MGLRSLIIEIIKDELRQVQSFAAIVKNVDEKSNTCTVCKDGEEDAPYYDVNLQAVGNAATGVFIYPKVKSDVYCQILEGNKDNVFITKTSEVEKVVLISNKNGGIIINSKLTPEIEKLNTNFKTLLNAIKTAPVVAQDGGASFKSALSAALQFNDADLSNVESKTVSHG